MNRFHAIRVRSLIWSAALGAIFAAGVASDARAVELGSKLRLDGVATWQTPFMAGMFILDEDRWAYTADLEMMLCTGTADPNKPAHKTPLQPHSTCTTHFKGALEEMIENQIVSDMPVAPVVTIEKLKLKTRKVRKPVDGISDDPAALVIIKIKFSMTSAMFPEPVTGKLKTISVAFDAGSVGDLGVGLLAVGVLGKGHVSAGSEVDCGNDCGAMLGEGALVMLSATPDAGQKFVGWSGCDSVNGDECTVTVEGVRVVHARFRPNFVVVQL